jgi:hypothetical protein
MKKIPDKVIFGEDALNNGITYGSVRNIMDENELINLLKLRLSVFFINQVQVLQDSRSAFPLATMTCIGIETLGEVLLQKDDDDTSYQFVGIIRKVDQRFGRKPNKKFEAKLKEIWSEDDLKNIDCFGKIVYRFFRNTMIHGYQGKGVFLSYEDTKNIEFDDKNAYLIINPDWFWNSFKDYFSNEFKLISNAQNNDPKRDNCLKYIHSLLD